MATDILLAALLVLGGAFTFVAGLGVLRMPDVLIRMHASTKAGTLGCGLILLGVAVDSGDVSTVSRAVAAVIFLLLTAPIAAHMIGRAAYRAGVPLWPPGLPDRWGAHGTGLRDGARRAADAGDTGEVG